MGNLVFIQYNRDASGKLNPLAKKHVDTGTGLERVTAAMQSIETGKILGNYEIDLFQTIIKKIEIVAKEVGNGSPYGKDPERDISYRAIADHARTMTFLIADGITPGNTDREYVLRRIIRRAARHGRYLGIHRPFLAAAHAGVVEAMGDAYPEIKKAAAKTAEVITQEESRFGETLDRGLELIDTELARHQEKRWPYAAGRGRVQALRHLRLSARSDRRRAAQSFNRRRCRRLQPPDGRAEGARTRRAQG